MESGDPKLIAVRDEGLAILRLNRPDKRNAIDDQLQETLIHTLERFGSDGETRALVLTGEGTAFCAGGDVQGMADRLRLPQGEVAARGMRRLKRTQRLLTLLHDLDAVTVAAVNGPAVGVGMDLALCCDVVLASERAMFSMAYVQRGLVPDGGGLYYLPRRIGLARAKELVYSGRRVEAAEALELGIADAVVPHFDLDDAAQAKARELSQGSPTATALAKAILNRSFESTREEVYARSIEAQGVCYSTEEHRASVAAFLARAEQDDRPDQPGTSDA